jgi:putative alpha-1,2-mannosidase
MVDLADQNGTQYFDRLELFNSYTGCMCGSPEVIIINDAYQKGIRNFDVAKAYEYSVNTRDKNGNQPGKYGVSVPLENDSAAWNMSQLAASLGKADNAKNYSDQAQEYHLIFNPDAPWTYDKSGRTDHPDWKGWFCNIWKSRRGERSISSLDRNLIRAGVFNRLAPFPNFHHDIS